MSPSNFLFPQIDLFTSLMQRVSSQKPMNIKNDITNKQTLNDEEGVNQISK